MSPGEQDRAGAEGGMSNWPEGLSRRQQGALWGAVLTGPVCRESQWGWRGLPGLQGTSVIMSAFPASEAILVQTA